MEPNKIQSLPFLTRKMLNFEHGAKFALQLDVIANGTGPVEIRGYTKEGPFTFKAITTGSSGIESFNFGISDLPIAVSVGLGASATVTNIYHASLFLVLDANTSIALSQGMVSKLWGISYPNQLPQVDAQANGAIQEIIGLDPAAGDNVSDEIPANELWEILAVSLFFAPNATVADRTVKLQMGLTNAVQWVRTDTTTIQASENTSIWFIVNGTTGVITANSEHEVALPTGIFLLPASIIKTVTTNIQATDNYATPHYLVRKTFIPG